MCPWPARPRSRGPGRRCRCPTRPPRPSWQPRCTFSRASSALLDDLQAHRARRALDHLHSVLGVKGVEVLALDLDDLAHGLTRDPTDLLPVRLGGTLLDPGGALQQVDRRRSLEDEREAAVLVDRDLRGHDIAGLRLGALVVGLGELHDVDAVRAQRGAHRRRRSRLAGLQLELEDRSDLFLAHLSVFSSFFLCDRECAQWTFSTWSRSSSTGVSRPNMLTSTLSLPFSGLISSTLPWKQVNGPSTTRTDSPTWNSTRILGASCFICFWIARTSFSWSGTGLFAEPTKLVTPGVLRTTNHDSFDITMRTRMYPGKIRFWTWRRLPSLISISSSMGTRTCRILSCMSIDSILFSRFFLTFSSCPEYACTTYHWGSNSGAALFSTAVH